MSTQPEADSNITLGEFVNSGLYGAVWKAEQKNPPRMVAVKIVNRENGMTFNAKEHAKGLVKAGPHPNIVAVYQVTRVVHPEDNEIVDAVVMELLDGPSLGQRLAESLLPPGLARAICDGVLNGIEHLHSKDVTHSDLHPGNVIITPQGPRIIDIDYSSAKSLALLTSLDRHFRIQADVDQTAYIVGRVISKTAFNQGYYDENQATLRGAKTLGLIEK